MTNNELNCLRDILKCAKPSDLEPIVAAYGKLIARLAYVNNKISQRQQTVHAHIAAEDALDLIYQFTQEESK